MRALKECSNPVKKKHKKKVTPIIPGSLSWVPKQYTTSIIANICKQVPQQKT